MDNIAISVEHVKKIYKLYDRNRDRLKDALGFSKKPLGKEHYALNDVSFQVGQGETVGIIGTNGSGKPDHRKFQECLGVRNERNSPLIRH